MYSLVIRQLVRFMYGKVSRGELRIPLLVLAEDVRFVFPGTSSFGGELHGKPALEAWMRRFASLRPEFFVRDAAVAGPPWHMRVSMRFNDRIVTSTGYVYENAGMESIVIRNGLIREILVFLDTEKVAALDAQLAGAAANPAAAAHAAPADQPDLAARSV